MIGLVHAIFSLALAVVFDLNVGIAVIASLLPDIDLILPIQHREIFHSLIFVVLVSFLFKIKFGKENAVSFALGFSSHLFLDVFSTMGIKVLWPLNYSFKIPIANSNTANLAIFTICLIFLLNNASKSFIFKEK